MKPILNPTNVDSCISIKGNDAISMAFAGVGNPKKEFVWRSSILNFASLKAENNGIKNAINGTILISAIATTGRFDVLRRSI